MGKKMKLEKDVEMPDERAGIVEEMKRSECKCCRYWRRVVVDDLFGVCGRIHVGVDVRIAANCLQTGEAFFCVYYAPNGV
jgi:hypothetical protein